MRPVSYTHLIMGKHLKVVDPVIAPQHTDEPPDNVREEGGIKPGLEAGPVSYTHLDVYKRQAVRMVACRKVVRHRPMICLHHCTKPSI